MLSIKDHWRDIKLIELSLHEAKMLHGKVNAPWAGAVPLRLQSAVDVGTDQRHILIFGSSTSMMKASIVVNPKIFAFEIRQELWIHHHPRASPRGSLQAHHTVGCDRR